jgi:hypothetical protein
MLCSLVAPAVAAAQDPGISVSAATIDFGSVTVNTAGVRRTLTITNTGDAPLTVGTFANDLPWGHYGTTCETPVAPGGTCDVYLRFAPTTAGAAAKDLTIASDAPGTAPVVHLQGAGVAPVTSVTSWGIEQDFNTGLDQNPMPDGDGNTGVWQAMYGPDASLTSGVMARAPGEYLTMLFRDPSLSGTPLAGWSGPEFDGQAASPQAAVNPTDQLLQYSATWEPGMVGLHPFTSRLAVLRWTAPAAGRYYIEDLTLADADANGGDGVDMALHRGPQPLASGVLANGETVTFASAEAIDLAAGESIDLTVGPGAARDHFYDTTRVRLNIRKGEVPPPPDPPAILMLDLGTVADTSNPKIGTDRPTLSGTAGPGTVTLRWYQYTTEPNAPEPFPLFRTATATAGEDGAWTLQADPRLPNGTYEVQASQTAAGVTRTSDRYRFQIETAPLLAITFPGSHDVTQPTQTTGTHRPTISGTTSDDFSHRGNVALEVRQYTGDPLNAYPTVFDTASVPAAGTTWETQFGKDLPDGTYRVEAKECNQYAAALCTVDVAFLTVTTAPSLTVTTPASSNPGAPSAFSDKQPTFSGTTSMDYGHATSHIQFELREYTGDPNNGFPTVFDAFSKAPSANWTAQPTKDLPDGTWQLLVKHCQQFNATMCTEHVRHFTVTTAPVVTIDDPPSSDASRPTALGILRPTLRGHTSTEYAHGGNVTIELRRYTGIPGNDFPTVSYQFTAAVSGDAWTLTPSSDLTSDTFMMTVTECHQFVSGLCGSDVAYFSTDSRIAPQNVELPQVQGRAETGKTLSAYRGTWTGTEPMSFEYRWLRCTTTDQTTCKQVRRDGDPDYVLGPDDVGHFMLLDVIAKNLIGEALARSENFSEHVVEAASPRCPGLPGNQDPDGDGLSNKLECEGLPGLDLPGMGADPRHKDLFLEIDFMKGHQVDQAAVEIVIKSFANAPVSNPDGARGINIHIDNGPASTMNPRKSTKWGALAKSNEVTHAKVLGSFKDDNPNKAYRWGPFDVYKKANFDSGRAIAFRYLLVAHRYGLDTNRSSGLARVATNKFGLGGSDFIMTLPQTIADIDTNDPATGNLAGTIMHEMGHTLGLGHGGRYVSSDTLALTADHTHNKPNYLSVMNYSFQLAGLSKTDGSTGIYDYSRFSAFTLSKVENIDEAILPKVGLAGFWVTGTRSAANYLTLYGCFTKDGEEPNLLPPGGIALNKAYGAWKCKRQQDVNGDGASSVLAANEDWNALVYAGGGIGGAGASAALPSETENLEADGDVETLTRFAQQFRGDTEPPTVKLRRSKRTLIVRATDNKKLAAITVVVDGKLKKFTVGGRRATKKVKLRKGRHRIVAVAFDSLGVASKPAKLRLRR